MTPTSSGTLLDTMVALGNSMDASQGKLVDAVIRDLVHELVAARRLLQRLREQDPARAERLLEALEDELVELIDL